MQMNVKPIPTLDARINEIRALTAQIVNRDILPNERNLWAGWRDGATDEERRSAREVRDSIKQKVKQAGLWAPHLPPQYGGAGLGFQEHAYMNEVLAYSMGAAALFGVVAPNSGNQQILLKYGTEEQKRDWLVPLTEGKMESGFSMTEPDSAARSALDQDHGAPRGRPVGDQRAQMVHLKRVSRRLPDRHVPHGRQRRRTNGRMTQIIVPKNTPGVRIVRGIENVGPAERPLRRSPTTTCACRSPTSSARRAWAIRLRRIVSARGAFITA